MKKSIRSPLLIVLLIYSGACAWLNFGQRGLIYHPTSEVQRSDAEEHKLDTAGETLKLWVLAGNKTDAIIYFGGNAENVAWNIPVFASVFNKYAVYLVNYRGYGGSTGQPSEVALFVDAVNIYDQLKTRHASVSVIGRSLGSGVAVYLASVREVDKLLLITPFDSVENIGKKQFPLFPVSLLLEDKYDSLSRAGKIEAPTSVLIAEHDEIIPRENSEALVAAFKPSVVQVKVLANTGHNFSSTSPDYLNVLREF
jgi:hypothetical protein